MTELRILRLDPDMPLPAYAHRGDAGLDLRAAADATIAPFERALIPTGLSIALPDGYAAYIQPRSGCAMKQGLSLVNTPGLVDSNYRGELKVAVINLDPKTPIEIHRMDRIAQMVVLAVPVLDLVEVSSLDDTDRGAGGFGSSGTA